MDVPIGELQVFFSLELREFTLGVGKEFLIQDSGDLSNFALFLPGKHFAIWFIAAIMQAALLVFTFSADF